MFFQQDFCKPAHADTADADEMNMGRLIKMNLIHLIYTCTIYIYCMHKYRKYTLRL